MRCDPFSPDTKDETPAFEVVRGQPGSRLVLTCDHASNRVPEGLGDLGLGEAAFRRHIAYDIGMRGVTMRMAETLGATAVLSTVSRLVIDPNRGEDDPTLVMRLSDGDLIPANARIGKDEVERRARLYHRPYRDAVAAEIERIAGAGETPMILAMHSFTPAWKSVPRPWHIGLLWDLDDRIAKPFLAALEAEGDIVVGDNEPYDGALIGDGMNVNGTDRGLPHVLVEIRQDLVASETGQIAWADRLSRLVAPLLDLPETKRIHHYGTRAGVRRPT